MNGPRGSGRRFLIGFAVNGRNGMLGVVDDISRETGDEGALLVIGGRSSQLRFHIPLAHVTRHSADERTVDVDVDVADFAPGVAGEGGIELRLTDASMSQRRSPGGFCPEAEGAM